MNSTVTRVCLALIALCGILSIPANAELRVEDFEDGSLGGFDLDFIHDIQADEINGEGPQWEFSDAAWVSPGHSLYLFPATDYVTFNLAPGEFVDYAEVWMAGLETLPTSLVFQVLGFDNSGAPLEWTFSTLPAAPQWVFASTEGQGFGQITEVRLTAPKDGLFDDLTVNVVPEPATIGLLALGLLGFVPTRLRKRRR